MLSIRPASQADLPHLLPLNRIVHDWHAAQYPKVFKPSPTDAELTAFFGELLDRETTFIDLAFWHETPAAYCFSTLAIHAGSALTHPRRHWHIEHIATAPEFRRKGIASALIRRAEKAARAEGCTEINLSSWADNTAAHAAFDASGFGVLRLWFAKTI